MGKRKQSLTPNTEEIAPQLGVYQSLEKDQPTGSTEAKRKRNRRQNISQSESEMQRQKDRERKQNERHSESELARAERLNNLRKRTQDARLNETEDETKLRLQKQLQRTNRRRENETEAERHTRIAEQSERTNRRREKETEAEYHRRISEQLDRTNRMRESESDTQYSRRVSEQKDRTNRMRENETEAQYNKRISEQLDRTNRLRERETESQYNKRISEQLDRTNRLRENEDDTEYNLRIMEQFNRTKTLRMNESDSENQTRLSQQRQRTQENRTRINAVFNSCAINTMEEMNESIIFEHDCGKMDKICIHCNAKHFIQELPTDGQFTVCCNKGTVKLPQTETDEYIKGLLEGSDPDSKTFMESIRSYNCAFGFVSVGVNLNMPRGFGPYCFRIHGQVYHRTSTLHPENGEKRSFSQLYILDEDLAVSERLQDPANAACKNHIMEKLLRVMQLNPFAVAYKMMHEVEESEKVNSMRNGQAMPNITMALLQNRNQDLRRYNAQKCNEVAVIFTSSDGEPPLERDLRIHLKTSDNVPKMQQVSILHKNLDALCYPLLFPKGEQGWGDDVMLYNPRGTGDRARKRVTLKMYYSFYLQVRDYFNPILSAGRLTQQYIVDAYVKAEANDLNYIRTHQKELRCDSYKNALSHYLETPGRDEGNASDETPSGRRIILPSSFSGSPRNMQELYQDAMSIVRKFGKPDLFVTMTCNPKWKEITDNLPDNHRAENRPDLVSRVFKLKLASLLDDIVKKEIFGKVIAKVHVIEFQKRGLPHAHILITLHSEYKPRTASLVDKIVCAEIPDQSQTPRLYSIVLSNMIHGPCGTNNSRSPCMVDGKCSKKFPKKFRCDTLINSDGYPAYRRRQTDDVVVGNNKINNGWVVPYNPFLSLKYNCHVNVEVCASFKSVKYLFKYAYKGTDCANVEVNIDEIKNHVDSRYVSPPEAVWRIFRYPMNDQTHAIIRLTVHLQDDPFMTFQPNRLAEALQRTEVRDTTLTAWFKLNQADEAARQYYYYEIPEHYVFQERERKWTLRKRGHNKVIGRILPVGINEKERYFLRLLLLHTKGAKSFNDLLTVDGQLQGSFHQVAKLRGLVLDEDIWRITLQEAAGAGMPYQLRELFAWLCLYSDIVDVTNLWTQFRDALCEDFSHRHGHDSEDECELCANFALLQIQRVLSAHGKQTSDYSLKTPTDTNGATFQEVIDTEEELQMFHQMETTLNSEQREAFNTVMNSLENSNSEAAKCFFLDGPGGTGKTYLYKCFLHKLRSQGKKVLPVASTGIAANLLKGGRTFHSEFKVPLKVNETSVSGIKPRSVAADKFRDASLIIWDEATMASASQFECVNRLMQEANQNETTFGGKTVLLGGDFRQTLPILPGADSAGIVQGSMKFSRNWHQFQQLKLCTNVRSADPEYSEWLIMLGNGDLDNDADLDPDMIEIPQQMITNECIVKEVFGENIDPSIIDRFYNTAILCPKNDDADEINARVLDILSGDEKIYLSVDKLDSDDNEDVSDYPIEFLNSLNPSGTAPHRLCLKVGSLIMLLRNLNTDGGLCNGTRLVVTRLRDNVIEATVITGTAAGKLVFIPRIDLITDSGLPFQLKRRQFPVKLAFAMTINKSQGQTLDRVGIYLPNPVFSHGQLYVAFSRVRKSSDVKVFVRDTSEQGRLLPDSNRVFTRNVVYKSIL